MVTPKHSLSVDDFRDTSICWLLGPKWAVARGYGGIIRWIALVGIWFKSLRKESIL